MEIENNKSSDKEIITWFEYITDNGVDAITDLENTCWAEWLATPPENLIARAEVFQDGQQAIVTQTLGLVATLSTNLIHWDGNPKTLPTWDDVAGDPTTYQSTYDEDGDTLCLMSMNVDPEVRGQRLPSHLIDAMRQLANNKNISKVIGSFRPSHYHHAVLDSIHRGEEPPTFEMYCDMKNDEGFLVDPWLRNLGKNGMEMIAVDDHAMYVPVSAEEFELFKEPSWQLINIEGKQVWWCGQTGFFYPQPDGSYVYIESNIWGSINVEK